MRCSGQQLPETSGSFLRDAVVNAVHAAESGVQVQAADLFSLGISCIKLAAAVGNLPKAADTDQAADMLLLTQELAEAIQKQHASASVQSAAAAVIPAPAVAAGSSSSRRRKLRASSHADDSSSSSHGSGPVLAALLWGRVLRRLGQGYVAAGSSIASRQSSQQAAGSAADAPAAWQQGAEETGGHATCSWAPHPLLGRIGLRVLTEQLLASLQVPGAPGSEGACSAAHQQLTQQCTQLRRQSDSLINSVTEAGLQLYWPSIPVDQLPQGLAAAMSDYSQQLLQFGEALCAQLPVPLCCESVAGASEQLLVAGKGCVCSRCK
jgi:hypothetical protein